MLIALRSTQVQGARAGPKVLAVRARVRARVRAELATAEWAALAEKLERAALGERAALVALVELAAAVAARCVRCLWIAVRPAIRASMRRASVTSAARHRRWRERSLQLKRLAIVKSISAMEQAKSRLLSMTTTCPMTRMIAPQTFVRTGLLRTQRSRWARRVVRTWTWCATDKARVSVATLRRTALAWTRTARRERVSRVFAARASRRRERWTSIQQPAIARPMCAMVWAIRSSHLARRTCRTTTTRAPMTCVQQARRRIRLSIQA